MDFHPPPPPPTLFFGMQMTFTILAPYLLLQFLQICDIFARIMLVQIHFFCPVIYMLKVPDRGRRELGDDSLPGPHFKVIFDGVPSLFEGFE